MKRTIHHITTMQCIKYALIAVCMTAIGGSVYAQQGTNDQVVIMKEYEGKVKDADKITLTPNIPEDKETTPRLTYNIPQKDFKDISFEPNPLKPLGMSTEKMERYNQSYIRQPAHCTSRSDVQ